jgi:four helix bundle protein
MNDTKSTFEDLEVWQLARELRKETSSLVKTFPSEEKYRLCDQMIRASRSITANIAEGYGRYHYQENIQYCRQARGSLFELIDHLTVALDEGYVFDDLFSDRKEKTFVVIRKLNGYIHYLEQRKSE